MDVCLFFHCLFSCVGYITLIGDFSQKCFGGLFPGSILGTRRHPAAPARGWAAGPWGIVGAPLRHHRLRSGSVLLAQPSTPPWVGSVVFGWVGPELF